jgi:hypothetical protein
MMVMYIVRRSKFQRLELKPLFRVIAGIIGQCAPVIDRKLWILANLSLKDTYNIFKINLIRLMCYLYDHELSSHMLFLNLL